MECAETGVSLAKDHPGRTPPPPSPPRRRSGTALGLGPTPSPSLRRPVGCGFSGSCQALLPENTAVSLSAASAPLLFSWCRVSTAQLWVRCLLGPPSPRCAVSRAVPNPRRALSGQLQQYLSASPQDLNSSHPASFTACPDSWGRNPGTSRRGEGEKVGSGHLAPCRVIWGDCNSSLPIGHPTSGIVRRSAHRCVTWTAMGWIWAFGAVPPNHPADRSGRSPGGGVRFEAPPNPPPIH